MLNHPPRTRLKVCCIASIDEARVAIAHGADALGLVARMPSGPGPIDDDTIASIAAAVPPPIATFLLTCETEPRAVVAHARSTGVNTVQLVDDSTGPDVYSALRDALPALRIVQVVHVVDRSSVDHALKLAPLVDALLLDSGNPAAAVRELGGTGRVHDWGLSREIVLRAECPVFLAGGLNPSNIRGAVAAVSPFGVDLCGGVRTNGRLDGAKLSAFVAALHARG
ncbi:MAG: phosphoribosylanthranilate isomerase [Phycisphaerales bacterium]|nr:phosphoribosylanthranilate isomerase [Phycisphaerales bacterium]